MDDDEFGSSILGINGLKREWSIDHSRFYRFILKGYHRSRRLSRFCVWRDWRQKVLKIVLENDVLTRLALSGLSKATSFCRIRFIKLESHSWGFSRSLLTLCDINRIVLFLLKWFLMFLIICASPRTTAKNKRGFWVGDEKSLGPWAMLPSHACASALNDVTYELKVQLKIKLS